jgi:hypothetical protein
MFSHGLGRPAPFGARLGNARFLRKADGRVDVKLPFAMTGPKTTAGKGVFRMAKVVADILRLIAELRPPLVTSTT